jgi:hypothetical protein
MRTNCLIAHSLRTDLMAKWAKKWYWREERDAERASGIQNQLFPWLLADVEQIIPVFDLAFDPAFDPVLGSVLDYNPDPVSMVTPVWAEPFWKGSEGSDLADIALGVSSNVQYKQKKKCKCGASKTIHPNQHDADCPNSVTPYCWCPAATGPNQPHESGCYRYRRVTAFVSQHHDWDLEPLTNEAVHKAVVGEATFTGFKGPFVSYGPPPSLFASEGETDYFLQVQAYNHALLWAEKLADVEKQNAVYATIAGVLTPHPAPLPLPPASPPSYAALPCDCGTDPPPNHYTDCPRFVAPKGWEPL